MLHTVRLADPGSSTKDMNYAPPAAPKEEASVPSRVGGSLLAGDELIFQVAVFCRHRPDKLLQVNLGSSPHACWAACLHARCTGCLNGLTGWRLSISEVHVLSGHGPRSEGRFLGHCQQGCGA